MRKKIILTSLLVLFITLFNESIFAYAFRCDETTRYCNYKGLYENLDETQEEFQMLFEPARHGNFQQMYSVLLYIFDCANTNQDCLKALKNPDCNISKYAQKLIKFYEDNKTNIHDKLVISMFEDFKKGEGNIFFSKEES